MKLAIVAGGPESLIPDLQSSEFRDYQWVGADHGTMVLVNNNIRPIRAFGDFDSLSEDERAKVNHSGLQLSIFPPEKDKTDLELALDWALSQSPEQCLLLGVTGGRQDHALASVQLLMKAAHMTTKLEIMDRRNCITLLTPGTYHIKKNIFYRYLSFLSLSEKVTGLTLKGVKYPLQEADLPLGSSLCISNEAEANVFTVALSQGYLLMMQCSD
ncbi:thiamine diphosphokinase [Sporolactobacillus kofuensis]|uniref:Thiamine diphosphokinase n=1 Tax=Sporolactobacillus kofuensis TaxID=269672 RepID=A0ABW1WEM7_9BACL|nr:thiamine diphosphokinase [Sporolactobacillus kofuensis]MCO7174655.1 thiamine diphosphokinase [Sporolactobacillus kofuensis]